MAVIRCTLKKYLAELHAIESTKPIIDRRHVPNLREISEEAGINYSTASRFANNRLKSLSFETAGRIVDSIRARGFNMQIHNIIDIYEGVEGAEGRRGA